MDPGDGEAEFCATSTKELKGYQPGVPNIELALKVVKKNYKLPEVEKKGAFSRLIVHLCNDEEERVKMVAFGGCADRMNALLEENALTQFTGIDVAPIFSEAYRYGDLEYELKANGASDATVIVPNYRPSKGMPFSKVADVDTAKPHQRFKLKGRLLTDFIPHGAFGLTGQATLRDPSGERQVYVQVLKVSPQSKTRFRANTSVAMKGTIKRFATVSGSVLRLIVESETDVDFDGDISKLLGKADTRRSSFEDTFPSGSVFVPPSPPRCSTSASSASASTSSASENILISGRIIADFDENNGHYWGMVEQSPDNNYEVTLLDVPDGAETLLIENEPISVRGRLQGYALTARRWKDVKIKGGDLFYEQEQQEEEVSKAMELRKLIEPKELRIMAKLLNYAIEGENLRITALVHDESKVIVKITSPHVPPQFRLAKSSLAGKYFSAYGAVVCSGAFCEMMVQEASSLTFQDDGEAAKQPEKQVPVAVKQEKNDDAAQFSNCNGRPASTVVQKPKRNAPGASFVGPDVVDLTAATPPKRSRNPNPLYDPSVSATVPPTNKRATKAKPKGGKRGKQRKGALAEQSLSSAVGVTPDVSAALESVVDAWKDADAKADGTGLKLPLDLSDSGIYSPPSEAKQTTLRHDNDSDSSDDDLEPPPPLS